MTYATVDDVAVDFDGLDRSDEPTVAKVATLLGRAEARIRQEFPDLDQRLGAGRTSVELIKQVESEMVASVLRNPGGYVSSTSSNTTGPWSETTSGTLSLAAASGLLRLTRDHRELLGDRAGGITSVAVGSGHGPAPFGAVRHPERFRRLGGRWR
jgi:hypothetical protein